MLPPRAYLFLALNAVRVLSLIALLLVFSSNITVIVSDIKAVNRFQQQSQQPPPPLNSTTATTPTPILITCDYIAGSTVPNQPAGVFWAVVNRLLIIFQTILLLLSELSWPSSFFNHYFPVLGPSFGLGALGIFQCLIGATVLSQHTDDFTLVSAFFLFSIGCLNILLGLIFRDKAKTKRSILSWREDAKSVLPKSSDSFPTGPPSFISSTFSTDKAREEYHSWMNGHGFGRQGEKAAGMRGFLLSKPLESLPRYASKPTTTSRYSAPSPPSAAPEFRSSGTAI
jgi:hypothetical protein